MTTTRKRSGRRGGTFLELLSLLILFGATSYFTAGCDGGGGSGGGSAPPPVNPIDPPVANDDFAATITGQPVTIDLVANDLDPAGGGLTVVISVDPSNGFVTNNNDGTVNYFPDIGYNGGDSFEYTIIDTMARVDAAGVLVSISPPGNNPPVAINDSATTFEDQVITIPVLINDFDPDGDPIIVGTATNAANGTVVINADSTIEYTPNPDFFGSDAFTYTIFDSFFLQATADVTVTVLPVNDAPEAVADNYSVDQNSAAMDLDVLTNDTDIEGDPLSLASVSDPANGTTAVNGIFVSYMPDPGFLGVDTFNYTVSDGNDTAVGSVSVNVFQPTALDFFLFGAATSTPIYDPSDGSGNFTVALSMSESAGNPGFPNPVQAFDLALDHDPAVLVATDVTEGAALIALGGADFFSPNIVSDGFILNVTVTTSTPFLLLGTPGEVALVQYAFNPGGVIAELGGVSSNLIWAAALNQIMLAGGTPVAPVPTDVDLALLPGSFPPGFHFLAPPQTVLYDVPTGVASFTESLLIFEETATSGTLFEGFQMGFRPDPALLTVTDVNPGDGLIGLNGGAGPDFFAATMVGDVTSIGVVFDFTSVELLTATSPLEAVVVDLATVASALAGDVDGETANLEFLDGPGPPAFNNNVSVGGAAVIPGLSAAAIQLVPTP